MGINFLFASTEKGKPNQLHAIIMFPDMELLQVFGYNDELTRIVKQGGNVIDQWHHDTNIRKLFCKLSRCLNSVL